MKKRRSKYFQMNFALYIAMLFHVIPVLAQQHTDTSGEKKILAIEFSSKIAPEESLNAVLSPRYEAKRGDIMSETFKEWSSEQGIKVIWEAQDLVFEDDFVLRGNLIKVLTRILDSVNMQGYSIKARYYSESKIIRFWGYAAKEDQ
jgi:hypothetical protein